MIKYAGTNTLKALISYIKSNFVLKSDIVKLSQTEYDDLEEKDPNVIYFINSL